jgi:hypothetical protein
VGVDPPGAEEVGHQDRVGHGEAVDDAGAGHRRDPLGDPGQALGEVAEAGHAEVQRFPFQRAPQHQHVVAELVGDIGAHPGVGRGGGGQDRRAGHQVGDGVADAAVIGAEVVAPVGDAVGLVDHQHPHAADEVGEHVGPEAGVVEPLRGDEQQVDLSGFDLLFDGLPVVPVGAVDGGGVHSGPRCHLELVAHQGEERRDEQGGAGALVPQ